MNVISSLFLGLAMACGAAVPAHAEALSSTKVGARAGLVDVDGLGTTFGVGGYTEIGVSGGLSVRPSLDYWQKSKSEEHGLAEVEVTVSDLTIGGAMKYAFDLPGAKASPYILGGLALHRLSAEVKASSAAMEGASYQDETSETEMGFDFGGGVAYPLSSGMELTGELLMRSVDTADLMTITSGLSFSL